MPKNTQYVALTNGSPASHRFMACTVWVENEIKAIAQLTVNLKLYGFGFNEVELRDWIAGGQAVASLAEFNASLEASGQAAFGSRVR